MSSDDVFYSKPLNRVIRFQDDNWPIASYPGLAERLRTAGFENPDIFARPAIKRGNLGWAGAHNTLQSTAWNEASEEQKQLARPKIEAAVQQIEATGDPELLPLLMVESPDAIRVTQAGEPMIMGWGAVPESAGSPEGAQRHFDATLGPFSTDGRPPFDFADGWTWATPVRSGYWHLLTPAICALILLVILLGSLIPGVLGRVSDTRVAKNDLLEQTLRDEIAGYEALLDRGVCLVDPIKGGQRQPIILPGGTLPDLPVSRPDGTLDPLSDDQVQRTPDLSPPLDPRETLLPSGPDANDENLVNLLQDLIDGAVILVISQSAEGNKIKTNIGSGTFVNETDILTNRHVIEDSIGVSQIYIGNRELGRLYPVEVIASSESFKIGEPDFALLRVAEPVAPKIITFSDNLGRLQNVIAAGFPYVVMQTDPAFERLKRNLNSAVNGAQIPEIVPTFGRVMARQQRTTDLSIILHRASISPGNSGGPLLDECGRLTGVNTFVNPDTEDGGDRIFYALSASSAEAFLVENGVEVTRASGQCVLQPAQDEPTDDVLDDPPNADPPTEQPQDNDTEDTQ
ncbi:MAG: trypsin-like peptidase domain-containing protein [Hyphomicrobiales bacterium]